MIVQLDMDTLSYLDTEFEQFCKDNTIIKVDKEFIRESGRIFYSLFIEYQIRNNHKKKGVETNLNKLEQRQYDRLRDWRNELASNEGIPPYILLYNSQITDIVKKQPQSKSELTAIRGLKKKADKYSEAIIKLLQEEAIEYNEQLSTVCEVAGVDTLDIRED